MKANLKVALAVMVVMLAAGVVAYDTKFLLSGSETGVSGDDGLAADEPYDSSAETSPEDAWEEEENTGSTGEHSQVISELLSGGPSNKPPDSRENRALSGVDGGTAAGHGSEDALLGKEWEGTVWKDLVASFMEGNRGNMPGNTAAGHGTAKGEDGSCETADTADKPDAPEQMDELVKTISKSPVENLRVQGIIFGKNSSSALVNGMILQAGDYLNSGKIVLSTIEEKRLIFTSTETGRTWTRHLEPKSGGRIRTHDSTGDEENRGSEETGDDAEGASGPAENPPSNEDNA